MADIIFYSNPQSRGRIVHWMLEELGEPYETRWLEYDSDMKGKAFLAVNPMGKVPTLSHRGAVVTEAAAICTYLAASYPDRALMPPVGDPALADFYRWMFFAAGPIEQLVTAKGMGWQVPEGRERAVGFGSAQAALDAVEIALGKGPFVCGQQFTAVDVYLGSALLWGMQFDSIEKRPAFEKYTQYLATRPAHLRANEINEARSKDKG